MVGMADLIEDRTSCRRARTEVCLAKSCAAQYFLLVMTGMGSFGVFVNELAIALLELMAPAAAVALVEATLRIHPSRGCVIEGNEIFRGPGCGDLIDMLARTTRALGFKRGCSPAGPASIPEHEG